MRRALAALFGGSVGKDTVSRAWRKVKSDWDAWNTRSLAKEPIVRLILDGTVVRVRLTKHDSISRDTVRRRGGRARDRHRVVGTWTYVTPASVWPRTFVIRRAVPAETHTLPQFVQCALHSGPTAIGSTPCCCRRMRRRRLNAQKL